MLKLRGLAVFTVLPLCLAQEQVVTQHLSELQRAVLSRDEATIRGYLESDCPTTRVDASLALWAVRPGAPEALATLRAALTSTDDALAARAASELANLGDAGARVLGAELRTGARFPTLSALLGAYASDSRAISGMQEILVETISTSTDASELRTAMALAARDPIMARAAVAPSLRHLRDADVAMSVLDVLTAAGPTGSFVAPLRDFINDDTIEFRPPGLGFGEYEGASEILCMLGPDGMGVVFDRLATVEDERRAAALSLSLQRCGTAALDAAMERVQAGSALLRRRLVGILACVEGPRRPEAARVLVKLMLSDRDADVRGEAAAVVPTIVEGIGALNDSDELRQAAKSHADEEVRAAALRCLVSGGKLPVDFLRARIGDPSRDVRVVAIRALGAQGSRAADAIDDLMAASSEPAMAGHCMLALAAIAPADRRVLDSIDRLLDADDEGVAVAAAKAAALAGTGMARAESRLRARVAADEGRRQLWMMYGLWMATRERFDLHVLLSRLDRDLLNLPDCRWSRDVIDVVTRLGSDGQELLPVIERILRGYDLSETEREWLGNARRAVQRTR